MVQKGTKIVLVFVFLLAGLLVAAQVLAEETSASASSASVQATPAGTSEANDQATDWFHHPAPWLDQGGDFRFREHFGYNWKTLRDDQKVEGLNVSRWHWERYRTRLWDTFKLDEDTTINTRFTWEFRQWNDPEFLRQRTDLDEIIMDTFNLTMKHFLGLPTTAVIGRQDIMLGQGWLVAEGTPAPLEGSRTLYFDAVRFTWDLAEKTTLDTIYIHNEPKSDWWLKPINDRDKYVTLEQENGAILYLTDKSNEKMQVEGYFIYKNNNPIEKPSVNNYLSPANMAAYSKKADIYTLGGALSGPVFNDNWNYRMEGAVQTGRSASPNTELTAPNQMERLLAFGEKSTLEYCFKDDLDNKVHITYEYLSGDDPHTKQVESFNPLWGEWPQWSELYQPYVTSMEDLLVSNMHRLDLGHKFKLDDHWEFLTDWNFIWAAQNTYAGNAKFSDDGKFRGNLFTSWIRYKFTKQLSGNFVTEYFMPGNYYAKLNNDDALYFHFTITYIF